MTTHKNRPDEHRNKSAGGRVDAENRGWSPSVNATHQEDNDSAHRSFHPDEYAAPPGPGRIVSKEETEEVPGDTVESTGRRGEEQGGKSGGKGTHDRGPKGPSRRPSGGEDASAVTGIDPQDADSPDPRTPRRA
ncbi:hypothetical protein ACIRL2_39465 [Embleya sp. NPDC127516]|uniref:hypothetical protein n=1 Tax=Embleya sp. NPDC127516 TaxID=3363990 RepID=UPI0037F888B3